MIALDMHWKGEASLNPPQGDGQGYVLFYGDEPVAEAQATWQFLVRFDLMVWSGEGCYQVHMDLADPVRPSVAWKFGEQQSLAEFQLKSEGEINASGEIRMADGSVLIWEPAHAMSTEYVIRPSSGDPLMKVSASPALAIGGNPGYLNLGVGLAGNMALPALVAMAFALTNEQQMLLHRAVQRDRPVL